LDNITSVVLHPSVEEELLAACRAKLPYEACGILYGSTTQLFGNERNEEVLVNGYEFIRNTALHPADTFIFHPEDWVSVFFQAQKNQRQIVGFFHTHPLGKAVPSTRDEQGSIPWTTYWIISLEEGHSDIAAYRRNIQNQWISLPIVRDL
jgi:proteasome lid subunit RPN8/RPN11